MVATDTHRMAVKKITIDEPATTPMRAIIPTKTLAEVSRLLPTDNPAMINIIGIAHKSCSTLNRFTLFLV